jgi:hypothetical protein
MPFEFIILALNEIEVGLAAMQLDFPSSEIMSIDKFTPQPI